MHPTNLSNTFFSHTHTLSQTMLTFLFRKYRVDGNDLSVESNPIHSYSNLLCRAGTLNVSLVEHKVRAYHDLENPAHTLPMSPAELESCSSCIWFRSLTAILMLEESMAQNKAVLPSWRTSKKKSKWSLATLGIQTMHTRYKAISRAGTLFKQDTLYSTQHMQLQWCRVAWQCDLNQNATEGAIK